ncbi:unnamed protein product [Pocillopora meandrina]|uniref:Uncharacterized protein n=1 Tax=Pocillopora meandrina TaxID=46732 RepID=A0AAU9W3C0_9CNID|nr:unnamed protein product [Pocillopora meandrina]
MRDLEEHLMQHHHMHPSFATVLIVPPDKAKWPKKVVSHDLENPPQPP